MGVLRSREDLGSGGGGVDVRMRVDSLNSAASALLTTDDARALELAELAATLAGPHDYQHGRAQALLTQGLILIGRGEGENALPKLLCALQAYEALRDHKGQYEALEGIGRLYLNLGELPQAEHHLKRALDLARHCRNEAGEARVLNLLAGVYHANGAYTSALKCLQTALELHRAAKNRLEEARTLCNIGNMLIGVGQYSEALVYLTQAYTFLHNEVSDERTKGFTLINLGSLYLDMGEPSNAIPYFREALEVAVARNDRLSEAVATLNIGTALQEAGDDATAEQTFREALSLSRGTGYRQGEVSALDSLGVILARRGEWQSAVAAHEEALGIARDIEDIEGELDALSHLGQLHAERDRLPEALDALEQTLRLAEEAERKKTVYETHLVLSRVYKRAGDFERALAHHELYHQCERALFNEESERKTRTLTVQFDTERARHEAEVYRLKTETEQKAREEAEAQVRDRTAALERAQLEVVSRLAMAAEYRDDVTGEHTWRVGLNAALLAQALELPSEQVTLIRLAARLHDVGKIGVPDALLLKVGDFTPLEREQMKAHAIIGARLLSGGQSAVLRMAENIAVSHHERWDGSGYPLGLCGERIPLVGRIVAVADVFDALMHERPYKRAWPKAEALAELERQAGRQFDPQVVRAALKVFGSEAYEAELRARADHKHTEADFVPGAPPARLR